MKHSPIPNPQSLPYLLTDFHVHTIASPDSLTSPEELLAACRRRGVERVVVADHNTIAGALRARELDAERVIVGEEIRTTEGELLAIFLEKEIPLGLTPMATIELLEKQNAFISVSHPFDKARSGSWKLETLLDILPCIDAIEIFNARNLWPGSNWQAQKFAHQHNLPGTCGSDAHAAFEVGRGSLFLPPFHDSESLRAALRQAIHPRLIQSAPWVHFTSRYAVWRKSRPQA
ncbi:MAG: hypothetical protein FJ010_00975 [Chloroflexi bacterium]|nr:hypothetical protein [Chloroflexota bacterium]